MPHGRRFNGSILLCWEQFAALWFCFVKRSRVAFRGGAIPLCWNNVLLYKFSF